MTRFRKPVVALLSLCLLAGGACSSGSKSQSPEDIAKAFKVASTKTLDAESMHFSVTMDIPGAGHMIGTGSQDVKSGLMAMTLNFPPFGPGEPSFKTEQILAGTTMYMKSDMFGLPEGVWMKLDLANLGEALGFDLGAMLDQSKQADPRDKLSFLEGVGAGSKVVGEGEIRGVKTTHYQVVIDLKKVMSELPEEAGDLEPLLEQMGDAQLPADVWLDDDGLVRRMTYEMKFPDEEAGQTEEIKVSMDFFDFGKPVDIKEPSAAESIDLMEALGALG